MSEWADLTSPGFNKTVLLMFDLSVRDVRFFAPDLFEISLERGAYAFVPGECAVLFNAAGDSRPYSIASGPEEPVLRFLLRRISGGALSDWLAVRRPGDRVQVSPPFGSFRPGLGGSPAVFVATGVGIAPFLSLLRSPQDALQEFRCLYGVRRLGDAVEVPLLQCQTDLQLAVSREPEPTTFHGRVTALIEQQDLPAGARFFLCGHDGMVDDVFDRLRARGVSADRISTEVFFSSDKN